MHSMIRMATPVLLFVVALATRLISWHSVFQKSGVMPHGNDAFYHLRRIRYSVEHFPDTLGFDPLMNFPEGAQAIWPPTFDWLIAAFLRGLPGIDQPDRLEAYAMLIPPILGAITVVLVYFLALGFFSSSVAVLSALSMAVLPAHSLYSRVGAVDHHVLVALVVAAMLGLAMALLRDDVGEAERLDRPADRARFGVPVALGVATAAAVMVWPGSLLQVGVLQIGYVIRLLTASDAEAAKDWALRFGVVHFVAGLVLIPMCVGNEWSLWGSFSAVVLSNFQPIYFMSAAVCFLLLGALWNFGWAETTRRARFLSSGLVGGSLVLGLVLAVPELLAAISESLSWLTKGEEFQSVVNESVPLFEGERGRGRAESLFGTFVYLVPIVIVYLVRQFRHRAEVLLLLGWALALFAATLVQWRFTNSYSIAHCLLIGLVIDSLHQKMTPYLMTRLRKIVAVALAVVVLLAVFQPGLRSYRLHFDNLGRSLRGEATTPVGMQRHARFVAEAARFLRTHSATGPSPFEAADYSVLGPWGDGHILKAIGERAVVQDNFGDDVAPKNFVLAEDYFSARREVDALAILLPMRTRYILVRSTGSGHSTGYSYESLFTRLYRLRGNRGVVSKAAVQDTTIDQPLSRHRLIYQSPPFDESDSQPYITLFEVVAGAELVGRAAPDMTLRLSLEITPRHGAGFLYNASVLADGDGIYRFRLPYANESLSPNVRVGRHYTLRAGTQRAKVVVPESAILSGGRIVGPSFDL